MKQLFPFHQLPADSIDQKMLIDRVKIEEKNQADEPSHGLRHDIYRIEILTNVRVGKEEGGKPDRQK